MEKGSQGIFSNRDEEGDTILHIAVAKLSDSKVAFILQDNQSKEILNAQNNDGQTALHLAVITDQEEIVKLLIKAGALQTTKLNDGDTVQHLAAKLGKNSCLDTLCHNITEETLQIQNEAGDTALHTSILVDNYIAFGIILGKVLDVNCKNKKTNETPLHYAVKKDKIEMVRDLLQRDADVNATTVNGDTPLHYVNGKEQRDLADALLQKGADIYVKNKAGKSPHDLADKTLARFLQRNRLDRKTRKARRQKEVKMDVDKPDEKASKAISETMDANKTTLSTFPGKKPKLCDDSETFSEPASFSNASSVSNYPQVFEPELFNRMIDDPSIYQNEAGRSEITDKFQFPNVMLRLSSNSDNFPGNCTTTASGMSFDQNSMQSFSSPLKPVQSLESVQTNQQGSAAIIPTPSEIQNQSAQINSLMNPLPQSINQLDMSQLILGQLQPRLPMSNTASNNTNVSSMMSHISPNISHTDTANNIQWTLGDIQNIMSQNNISTEELAKFIANQNQQT